MILWFVLGKFAKDFWLLHQSDEMKSNLGAEISSCGWKSASSRALSGQFGECLQKWMWEGVDNVWHYLKLIALLCVAQEQRKSLTVSMLCKCNWFFMLSRGVSWTRRQFQLKGPIQSVNRLGLNTKNVALKDFDFLLRKNSFKLNKDQNLWSLDMRGGSLGVKSAFLENSMMFLNLLESFIC